MLFDAGNTLVFLDHAAVADALAELGVEVTAEAIADGEREAVRIYQQRLRETASHSWTQHFSAILTSSGIDGSTVGEILPRLREVHDAFNFWRRVPIGLLEALDRLRANGVRVAVVSNSEGKLDELFDRIGLSERLELVVDSALEGVSKPDPEIFRRALTRLDLDSSDAIYLGDLPEVDVRGARAAGLTAVLIDPEDRYATLDDVWRVPSVEALVDELLRLPA